jgi:hypothetical protein
LKNKLNLCLDTLILLSKKFRNYLYKQYYGIKFILNKKKTIKTMINPLIIEKERENQLLSENIKNLKEQTLINNKIIKDLNTEIKNLKTKIDYFEKNLIN